MFKLKLTIALLNKVYLFTCDMKKNYIAKIKAYLLSSIARVTGLSYLQREENADILTKIQKTSINIVGGDFIGISILDLKAT